jgi:WD40 repeat protein
LEAIPLLDKSDGVGADASAIRGISWSANGRFLAVGGNNRIVVLGLNGERLRTIDAGDEVNETAWSPDGQIVAAASGDVIKLWTYDGHLITTLTGHTRGVTSLSWNKQTLVTASKDGTVRLWEIDKDFARHPLDTLLAQSCNWLRSYLSGNPLATNDDSDLQDLCRGTQEKGKDEVGFVAPQDPVAPVTTATPSALPTVAEVSQPTAAGVWDWFNGEVVYIKSDGTTAGLMNGKQEDAGTWILLKPEGVIRITWISGWQDQWELSADGRLMKGFNQNGNLPIVHRKEN